MAEKFRIVSESEILEQVKAHNVYEDDSEFNGDDFWFGLVMFRRGGQLHKEFAVIKGYYAWFSPDRKINLKTNLQSIVLESYGKFIPVGFDLKTLTRILNKLDIPCSSI